VQGATKADATGAAQSLTRKQVERMNKAIERLSAALLPLLKYKGVVE